MLALCHNVPSLKGVELSDRDDEAINRTARTDRY